MNMNMVANEAFLDTASVRSSVVSHAKTLGYTPNSVRAPIAFVNVTLNNIDGLTSATIPVGTVFTTVIDNINYQFVTVAEHTAQTVNGVLSFSNIPIYEGTYVTNRYTVDSQNVEQKFTLNSDRADTTTLLVDVFDSASYAKFASRNSLMFTWGTRNLDELEELPNEFSAFPGMTAAKLKKLDKKERQKIIAKHNLMTSFAEIRRIKQAIHDGLLWELVENRLRSSPALMKVFEVIENNIDWIGKFEPAYRYKTPIKSGEKSNIRPIFSNLSNSFEYGEMLHPYFGKVPNHLSETYPFHPGLLQDDIEGFKMQEWDIARVRSILDYQFGKGIGKMFTDGETELVISRKTRRLRNLLLDGEHVASLSHRRGMFILQKKGAILLHKHSIHCSLPNRSNDFRISADLRYCLLYTSPSPRDVEECRMPSSA